MIDGDEADLGQVRTSVSIVLSIYLYLSIYLSIYLGGWMGRFGFRGSGPRAGTVCGQSPRGS